MTEGEAWFKRVHPLPHRNVFVMMRFTASAQHQKIFAAIDDALKYYGFNALRADQRTYDDDLWENIKIYIDGCDYGLAVFDQIDVREFNPNVALELGYMMGHDKPCLVLKEKQIPRLPSDLAGKLYREFDSYSPADTIRREIDGWMRDLDVLPGVDEKLVVFVSTAGIDRCAMAKAILDHRLKRFKTGLNIRTVSAGRGWPYRANAAPDARLAIQEVCGTDRLKSHRPQYLSPMLIDKATLILVMESSLLSGLPAQKSFNLKDFFGGEGDVEDPAFVGEEGDGLKAYYQTAYELRDLFSDPDNLGKLGKWLNASSTIKA